MTQLLLNIENPAVLPVLRRMVGFMEGVSVAKTTPARKPRRKRELSESARLALEESLQEAREGKVHSFDNVDDMMAFLMAEDEEDV